MAPAFQLKYYLLCMEQIPPLSGEDLQAALHARAKGDEWARRLLEERFLPLALRWVQPYRGQGLSFEALIQAGNRALLRGLRQLKPGMPDAEDYLERCVAFEIESLIFATK